MSTFISMMVLIFLLPTPFITLSHASKEFHRSKVRSQAQS